MRRLCLSSAFLSKEESESPQIQADIWWFIILQGDK
jgi:hypothetical protein